MSPLRASRLAAWIAIFAMALAALAPTLSRALAWGSASPGAWAEVCTVSGPQWRDLATPASSVAGVPGDGQPAHADTLAHCPFCLLTADRLGPVPDTSPRLFAPGDPVAPAGPRGPLFRSFSPLAAHARGPPLTPLPPSAA